MKKLWLLITICIVSLSGQTGVKLVDGLGNEMIYGAAGQAGKRYDSGLQTIATGAGTVITTTKTFVQAIHCNTINSTASTVKIQDGNGVVYWDTLSLLANTATFEQFGSVGMTFVGGVKIIAGTSTALNCQIVGVQ